MSTLPLFTLFLIQASLACANNYDDYMARLAAESRAVHDEFLLANPNGHRVLKRYASPSYKLQHPILGDPEVGNHEIDRATWEAFVRELNEAREEASREPVGDDSEELPTWYDKQDESSTTTTSNNEPIGQTQEAASRRNEAAFQNQLWGEHKVSGGSGEIGQWLDYALLGAGSQDDDEEEAGGGRDNNLSAGSFRETGTNSKGNHHSGRLQYKNDSLPTYCNPPNPCPLGYDPGQLSTPCDSNTEYTMELNREWILNKITSGECTCDTEHMDNCPEPAANLMIRRRVPEELQDTILTELRNPYLQGLKRKRLVAKKAMGPKMIGPNYYYMHGKVLKKVVKKDGRSV